MRSGSSAHDGRGWSPAQHPYPGQGPRSEQDVPLGPEVSWPAGFGKMDFDTGEYRRLVESTSAGQNGHEGYEHVDPRYRSGPMPGYQPRPVAPPAAPRHQQSAMDDHGYGDPGYADPSYDGPRDNGGYPSRPAAYPPNPPAYQPPPPGYRPAPDPIYPVTGAQEVYRDPGDVSYPPRYDEPRYEEPRPADPRLAGLRYDELRYDDADFDTDARHEEPRYDEPLDDDAWYEELRRGGPAFTQRPPGPGEPNHPGGQGRRQGRPSAPSAPAGPTGPVAYPQGPPTPPAPGYDHAPGYDQGPGHPNANGNGNGAAPRMSLPPGIAPSPVVGPHRAPQLPPAYQSAPALAAPQYHAGPTFPQAAPVGVLAPPVGSRYDPRAEGRAEPRAEGRFEGRLDAPQARPGAMPGPDTMAWSAADVDELEAYWRDDAEEPGYSGLLHDHDHDRDLDDAPARRGLRRNAGAQVANATRQTARQTAETARQIGRRRGRSNDHRLWLGLGGVVVVAAAAIFGIIKFEFPAHHGPVHSLSTPAKISSYQWAPNLDKQQDLTLATRQFSSRLGAGASNVVSRVYELPAGSAGSATQIVMFMGAHLPNQSPASSLANFLQKYPGAQVVPAGPLGGDAACVETTTSANSEFVAMCAWFDNDSVGVLSAPNMTTSALAAVMQEFRPAVEHVVKP